MPISDKYKIIFIHIPKCAGISMWHALELEQNESSLISFNQPVLQHLLPLQLKDKYINSEKWYTYTKITIIRNPYDRVVSDYFWMKEHVPHIATGSFDDFLTLREQIVNNNQYHLDLYYDHFYPMYMYFENIDYDFVLRFENLESDFEKLKSTYNIQGKLNKHNFTDKKNFELTSEQKKRIYSLYKKDFLKFKYKKQLAPTDTASSPLKVIITGMEHSGTTFLSNLITSRSSIINTGFECGVLLSNTPQNFYKIKPFYDWLSQPEHLWGITNEQKKKICDVDTFEQFYLRLKEYSSIFNDKQIYILDKTPAYSYNLSSILKKVPNVPIVVIIKNIELLWVSYYKRNVSFEVFVKRFLSFKSSLLNSHKNKNIKIVSLENLANYDIKEIKDIFSFINLPYENKDNEEEVADSKHYDLAKELQAAQQYISDEQKLILKEIDINFNELNKKNDIDFKKYYDYSNLIYYLLKKTNKETNYNFTNFKIQVFLSKDDLFFTEENSFSQFISLNAINNIEFELDLKRTDIKYIRFDIGEEPGLININNVSIKNSSNEMLWTLSPNEIKSKKSLFFLKNKDFSNNSFIQLSLSNDPQFVVEIPTFLRQNINENLALVINVSSLSEKNISLLNLNTTNTLSFISEEKFDELKLINETLSNQNKKLLTEKTETQALVLNIEKSIEKLSNEVDEKESFISVLESNIEKLNSIISLLNDTILLNDKTFNTLIENKGREIISLQQKNNEIDKELSIQKEINSEAIEKINTYINLSQNLSERIHLLEETYVRKNIFQIIYYRMFNNKNNN